jgi:hypothetical protein
MLGAPGSSALAPPGGPSSTFLSVGGGRSWFSSSDTTRGPVVDVFYVDGGRSRTFSSDTSWISDGDRWWPLSEILPAPPRGPLSTSSTSVVAAARPTASTPGGLPSTSSTSMVVTVGPAASTLRGPAINVFNFSGDRCWTCRQHPQGARHRRLQFPDLSGVHRRRFLPLILVTPGPPALAPRGGPPSTAE